MQVCYPDTVDEVSLGVEIQGITQSALNLVLAVVRGVDRAVGDSERDAGARTTEVPLCREFL